MQFASQCDPSRLGQAGTPVPCLSLHNKNSKDDRKMKLEYFAQSDANEPCGCITTRRGRQARNRACPFFETNLMGLRSSQ
jgi:hypothetical protein